MGEKKKGFLKSSPLLKTVHHMFDKEKRRSSLQDQYKWEKLLNLQRQSFRDLCRKDFYYCMSIRHLPDDERIDLMIKHNKEKEERERVEKGKRRKSTGGSKKRTRRRSSAVRRKTKKTYGSRRKRKSKH